METKCGIKPQKRGIAESMAMPDPVFPPSEKVVRRKPKRKVGATKPASTPSKEPAMLKSADRKQLLSSQHSISRTLREMRNDLHAMTTAVDSLLTRDKKLRNIILECLKKAPDLSSSPDIHDMLVEMGMATETTPAERR